MQQISKAGLVRYIGKGISKALVDDTFQMPEGCLWAAIQKAAQEGWVDIKDDFATVKEAQQAASGG